MKEIRQNTITIMRKVVFLIMTMYMLYIGFGKISVINLIKDSDTLYLTLFVSELVIFVTFIATQIVILFKKGVKKWINIMGIITSSALILHLILFNMYFVFLTSLDLSLIFSFVTLPTYIITIFVLIIYIILCSKDKYIENSESEDIHIHPGKLLLFGILSFGIYFIVWYYRVIRYFESQTQESKPIMEFLFVLLIPFYFIYWIYKVSGQVYTEQKKYSVADGSFSVLALILAIFGMSIISILIIQDNINKIPASNKDTEELVEVVN